MARVQGVVTVLDAIQSRDLQKLEQWIDLRTDNAGFHWKSEHYETMSVLTFPDRDIRNWLWKFSAAGNDRVEQFVRLASGWVQDEINGNIASSNDRETAVSARVLFNEPHGAFLIHIVPRSLLAAIWLQCARVLTVNPTFRACENCGKWFESSADTKRKQTKYCSDSCKVAASRSRRKAAIIPMACPACGKKMIVECEATSGFGYMNFSPVECPHCNKVTMRQLPSSVIDVRRAEGNEA